MKLIKAAETAALKRKGMFTWPLCHRFPVYTLHLYCFSVCAAHVSHVCSMSLLDVLGVFNL